MLPLHLSARYANTPIGELLQRSNALDARGRSALHLAVVDKLELVRPLLLSGADVNAKDRSGRTPIFYAFDEYIQPRFIKRRWDGSSSSRWTRQHTVKFLLENGADAAVRDDDGVTALHLLARGLRCQSSPERLELLELLLKHGAEVNAKDARNETPLQVAVSALNFEAVRILLDHGADAGCVELSEDRSFRDYKGAIPCFEAVDNLVRIVDLLATRGRRLGTRDELVVLKFIAADHADCRFDDLRENVAICLLDDLLKLGTDEQIERGLSSFRKSLWPISFEEQANRRSGIRLISKHLWILARAGFQLSDELRSCLLSSISSLERGVLGLLGPVRLNLELEPLEQEVGAMKATMLNTRNSLYEAMSTGCCWKDCAPVLRATDFAERFPMCGSIVKGWMAKGLVRRRVVRAACERLGRACGLPVLCCEKICGFLSNESLMNLCLAR